jgi:hypothetical protein
LREISTDKSVNPSALAGLSCSTHAVGKNLLYRACRADAPLILEWFMPSG